MIKESSEWADDAWGNIQKRREDTKLKNRNFIAEEDRIKRDTPALWEEARAMMKAMCDAFNKRAGSDILIWDSDRPHQALIRIEPSSVTFHASFNLESLRLHLYGKQLNETYSPVVSDGRVLFSGAGRISTAEEIAKRFLAPIVKLVP